MAYGQNASSYDPLNNKKTCLTLTIIMVIKWDTFSFLPINPFDITLEKKHFSVSEYVTDLLKC